MFIIISLFYYDRGAAVCTRSHVISRCRLISDSRPNADARISIGAHHPTIQMYSPPQKFARHRYVNVSKYTEDVCKLF